MRKSQFVLSLMMFAALSSIIPGCCESEKRIKSVNNCPDPMSTRDDSFKRAQSEMKDLNKKMDAADKKAKKNGTYNQCQPVNQPVVYVAPQPNQQPTTASLPGINAPPPAEGFVQAAPGAKFYIVVTAANNYPGAELRGCLNDGEDMVAIGHEYAQAIGISPDRIVLYHLRNSQYSTAAALKALNFVADNIKAGDYFLYWNSGHGAQYAGKDISTEPDGLNEVICPQDFDWSEEHMITDKQLNKIFSKIPKGVIANWGSDSCHSGDLDRDVPPSRVFKYKAYPESTAPANVKAQLAKARAAHKTRALLPFPNIAYLSGCRNTQLSADLQDNNGRPCGGLTWSFRTQLTKYRFQPMPVVTAKINEDLDSMQLNQNPQLEGPPEEVKRPFLQPAR